MSQRQSRKKPLIHMQMLHSRSTTQLVRWARVHLAPLSSSSSLHMRLHPKHFQRLTIQHPHQRQMLSPIRDPRLTRSSPLLHVKPCQRQCQAAGQLQKDPPQLLPIMLSTQLRLMHSIPSELPQCQPVMHILWNTTIGLCQEGVWRQQIALTGIFRQTMLILKLWQGTQMCGRGCLQRTPTPACWGGRSPPGALQHGPAKQQPLFLTVLMHQLQSLQVHVLTTALLSNSVLPSCPSLTPQQRQHPVAAPVTVPVPLLAQWTAAWL